MDFEFEKRLARLTGQPEPHYGDWKRNQMAGAQRAQREGWGELKPGQRSINEPRND